MAIHLVQNKRLDIISLNHHLTASAQGDEFRFENCTLLETHVGTLLQPTLIPVNRHVHFERSEFEGRQAFTHDKNAQLTFSNCTFRDDLTISGSREGHLSFAGVTRLAAGITWTECEKLGLYIPSEASFEIHPEWCVPPDFAKTYPRHLRLMIRRSSGGVTIKGCNIQLMFQAWESKLRGIDIDVDDLRLFELLRTDVESLSLTWRKLGSLRVRTGTIGYSGIPSTHLLQIPFRPDALESGIDSSSLEAFARTAKKNGDLDGFVRLFTRAGEAGAFMGQKTLSDKLKKTNWREFNVVINLSWSLVRGVLENQVMNRWFRRFYSPSRIFITQLGTVIGFAGIFWFFKDSVVTGCTPAPITSPIEALYFSSATFLTIGYGDILAKGWLQLVVSLEGFSGLILGLLLAVAASRKYAS